MGVSLYSSLLEAVC